MFRGDLVVFKGVPPLREAVEIGEDLIRRVLGAAEDVGVLGAAPMTRRSRSAARSRLPRTSTSACEPRTSITVPSSPSAPTLTRAPGSSGAAGAAGCADATAGAPVFLRRPTTLSIAARASARAAPASPVVMEAAARRAACSG